MKITKEVFNIAGRIARSFNKTTGIEYDDLYAEALYAYCLNAHNYDAKYGAISTYFYHIINNHMKNYIDKNYTRQIATYYLSQLNNFDIEDKRYYPEERCHSIKTKFILDAF